LLRRRRGRRNPTPEILDRSPQATRQVELGLEAQRALGERGVRHAVSYFAWAFVQAHDVELGADTVANGFD
jgi:hypothetical protein